MQDAEPETEPETGHNGKQSPLAMELERNREAMAVEAGTKSPSSGEYDRHHQNGGSFATLHVSILQCDNLCPADASGDSDPFVRVNVGSKPDDDSWPIQQETSAVRDNLSPRWTHNNYFTFKLPVHDDGAFLQDSELQMQLQVLDHDTFSAHDLLGELTLDLGAVLPRNSNDGGEITWTGSFSDPDGRVSSTRFDARQQMLDRGDFGPEYHDNGYGTITIELHVFPDSANAVSIAVRYD